MDVELFGKNIVNDLQKYGAVILTVTNNSGGGQYETGKHRKAVQGLQNTKFITLGAVQSAENAYFDGEREEGYANKELQTIAKKCLSLADGR